MKTFSLLFLLFISQLTIAQTWHTKLDSTTKDLDQITHLDLSKQLLNNVPDLIFQLPNLSNLNLSHNNLQEIPNQLYKLKELRSLNLSYNPLILKDSKTKPSVGLSLLNLEASLVKVSTKKINKFLSRFPNLEDLNLSNNQLNTLPKHLLKLKLIQQLSVQANTLTHLPSNLHKLSELKYLDLSSNEELDLENTAPDFFKLKKLHTLKLKNNKLTTLPIVLYRAISLKKLDCSNNELSTISNKILQLTRLNHFDASNNKLNNLPNGFSLLENLRTIDLSVNQISTIPLLSHMYDLDVLNISDNPITSLPKWFNRLHSLKQLNLSSTKLRKVDFSESKLSQLEVLKLNHCKQLSALQGLSKTNIKKLGLATTKKLNHKKVLAQLKTTQLKVLNLSSNGFVTLPIHLNKLKAITTLNLAGNPAINYNFDFWAQLKQLQFLTHLNLAENNLQQVTLNLEQLNTLETLILEDNNIEKIRLQTPNTAAKTIRLQESPTVSKAPFSLKLLALKGNKLSNTSRKRLETRLPSTTINYE